MRRPACGVAVIAAAFLSAVPGLSSAQRGRTYSCDGELPPAFAHMVVVGCDTLAEGKHHLSRTESRRIAGTMLRDFLSATAATESRTVTNIRPTVYAMRDPRLDAYCGIATFTDRTDASVRQTLEYNTTIWYIVGGIYLVTVGTGNHHCLQHPVKVRFRSRRVSSKKVAAAVVERHLRRLYGAVESVRITGIKSRRAKEGDYYRRARVSFTFVHPDGFEERLKQALRLIYQDVSKRGTWWVDLQRVG